MGCVDENAAVALLDGRLPAHESAELLAHAAQCNTCRELVAELAKAATVSEDWDGTTRPTKTRNRGDTVGRYVLLGHIGEGGMGVVHLGYDPDLDRRVALKFLRASKGDDTRDRQRLLREAQAIAKLSHPNVVSVFDVGTADGDLYVAMEYVAGLTLREWLAAETRSWQAIVARFVDAGRGLAAAHAAGIVHRDFKPENVIVSSDGRARVLDFGLAIRDSAASPFLVDGDDKMITTGGGTPRYMAPEQLAARADVGPAADQFSFCVALYEALYGQHPFEAEHALGLTDPVAPATPRPPPAATRVPPRIMTVVARGLAPDPAARYPSLDALLSELSPRTRSNRTIAVAVAVAMVAIAAGAYAFAAQREHADETCSGADAKLATAWNTTTKAAGKSAFLASGVPYAAFAWDHAEAILERYGRDWSAMHTSVCQATVRKEQSPQALDLRMTCLSQRLDHLEAAAELFTRADRQVVEKSGQVTAGLGALAECADVDVLAAPMLPPVPATRATVEQVRGDLARAQVLAEAGKYTDAQARARAALTMARTLAYEPVVAEALLQVGQAQMFAGSHEPAEQTLRDAFIAAEASSHGTVAVGAAAQLVKLVGILRGNRDEGTWWARVANATAKRTHAMPAQQALVASAEGQLLGVLGKHADALVKLEQALAIRQKLFGADHLTVATSHATIASVLRRQGNYDDAVARYQRVLAIREQALGSSHPSVADSRDGLGVVLQMQGKLDPALVEMRRALAIRENVLGLEHPEVANSYLNIGGVLEDQGKSSEALASYRRALVIYERTNDPARANVHLSIGSILRGEGKLDEADTAIRLGLAMFETNLGSDHPEVGKARSSLGNNLAAQGKHAEAITELRRALEIAEHKLGPDHPDVAAARTNIGGLLLRQAKYADALVELERALAIQTKALGPDHPHTANTTGAIGLAYLGQRKFGPAVEHLQRALAVVEATTPDDHDTLGELRIALARATWANDPKQHARAIALATTARADFALLPAARTKLRDVDAWLRQPSK